jgi:hypothetical protein
MNNRHGQGVRRTCPRRKLRSNCGPQGLSSDNPSRAEGYGVPHHLVGPQEAAELLNISRQRLQILAARPDFPEPVVELALGRVWKTEEIIEYGRRTGRIRDEDDKP